MSIRFPKWFVRVQIRCFGRWFSINWDDVKKPIGQFESLQAFFIREIKSEKRPIDADKKAIISPCDGAYGQSGVIQEGMLLQVKGKSYTLSSLVANTELAAQFEGGGYATLYLAPSDYHRFHAPCHAGILKASYLPGYLWPVNPWAVAHIDQLFCVNERLICVFGDQQRKMPTLIMVPVGATMVGKVRVRFDAHLTTNYCDRDRRDHVYQDKMVFKGEEVGLFEFGSTIVLMTHPQFGSLDVVPLHSKIKMGERIGSMF